MTTTDPQIVQAAGNLHDQIGHARFGEAQHLFDNPTPFDASDDMLDDHAYTGANAIEHLLTNTQFLALGLFLGCWLRTPSGS